MRKIVAWALACCCTAPFIAVNAHAEWEYTEWGMSPDEVVAAATTQGIDVDWVHEASPLPSGGTKLLVSEHRAAGHLFDVDFIFQDDRLNVVGLSSSTPERCGELARALVQTYGEPEFQERIYSATNYRWRDVESGNVIQLLDMGGRACRIVYRPTEIEGL